MKNSYGCRSQKPFCLCQESSASNCWAGVALLCQWDGRHTDTLTHNTHTHETQERIVSDAVLSRNHKWAEQESAARHHPSATTGCSGQHPHDFPPWKNLLQWQSTRILSHTASEVGCNLRVLSPTTICTCWSWTLCRIYVSLLNIHRTGKKKCRK